MAMRSWAVVRGVALGLALLAGMVGPSCAAGPPPCVGAIPCYESPGFTIRVVDQETGQPLADVHALAEWINYGRGRGVAVMAQDAVSGPDGVLVFPSWGPVRGYHPGMIPQFDPVITLFKPGYLLPRPGPPPGPGGARLLYNRTPWGTTETTRVRRYGNDGGTVAMEPFRGSPKEWIQHLEEAMAPGTGGGAVTADQRALFGAPYRNRDLLVKAELEQFPNEPRAKALLGALRRSLGEE
jgi:hypothetical protein